MTLRGRPWGAAAERIPRGRSGAASASPSSPDYDSTRASAALLLELAAGKWAARRRTLYIPDRNRRGGPTGRTRRAMSALARRSRPHRLRRLRHAFSPTTRSRRRRVRTYVVLDQPSRRTRPLPPAVAVVNPKQRQDEENGQPFRAPLGAGQAVVFLMLVRKPGRRLEGRGGARGDPDLMSMLDPYRGPRPRSADIRRPLVGPSNRRLRCGGRPSRVMARARRGPGLAALADVARLGPAALGPNHLG